ncbi:TIGR03756 family integrating conjugative element protein [Pasteurella multocida]|uniref:TIGR03756 family integrating conjugative element protein n=1 Tax=Pasteurella multocida TaxID=747 RepID=UPI0029B30222|nr:TIGR03756 family integrating conjugative element protein [Pasteurella multocida]MDX3903955.1 TIGR03756 family integrating conjugative element protein [Pasteurella multocida]MDX3983531.1 TIGR03756 family integrating conjugative element protein [Pasteurella multocida]
MKRTFLSVLLSISLAVPTTLYPQQVKASLNTASIAASSASTSCLEYKVVGTCFWLFCTYFGCKVRTSTKIKHYLPEMVISAYNHDGQTPWQELSSLNEGKKGGEYRSPQRQYSQLSFKNADAFGHPQGAIGQLLNNTGYYCKAQTTPFMPYFLSSLDFFAWREHMPEMFYPEAMTPGMREVGNIGDTWGNIYPRSGFITQVNDYKTSATIVQRVADIVSRYGQPHLYMPAARQGGAGEWYPGPVWEGQERTHKWQMLYPNTENTCSVFPEQGSQANFSSKISEKGDYSWALWRPYSCCKRRGQTFLYSIDWSH